jgi:PKD domain
MSSKFVLFISLSAALSALLFVRCDYATTPDLNCVETASFEFFRVDTGLCASGCTYRFQSTIVGGDNLNYTWNFGDNETSDQEIPEHSYDAPGTYQVSLVISQDACSNFVVPAQTLTIGFPAPVAKITTALPAVYTFPNTTVQFDAGMSSGAVSYLWDFGDGTTSPVTAPSHNYLWPDTFMVVLQATGQGNDKDRDTLWVRVEPKTFNLEFNLSASETNERIMAIEEAANGSFNAVLDATSKTYTVKFSREGALTPASLSAIAVSGGNLGYRGVRHAQKLSSGAALCGYIQFGSNNEDAYVLNLNQQLESASNPLVFYGGGGDGYETAYDIVEMGDGSFWVCGDRTNTPSAGMLFQKLTAGFTTSGNAVFPFTGDAHAYAMVRKTNGNLFVLAQVGGQTRFIEFTPAMAQTGVNQSIGNDFPVDLLRISDTRFVMLGINGSSSVVKILDGQGVTLHTIPVTATLNRGLIAKDGSLIIVGSKFENGFSKPFWGKINLATAMVTDSKTYPIGSFSRTINYVAQTADNGFIMGGEDFNDADRKAIIIRVNHRGEIVP